MNILIEKIYDVAPNIMKDIMTSAYGLLLYRERYTGKYDQYLNELVDFLSMPLNEILKIQNKRLEKIVLHAYENVPYYNKLFKNINISPKDIKTKSDLHKIPILDKSIIRKKPESLLARNVKKSKRIMQFTSGTTGTPLKVFNSLDGLRYSHALEYFIRDIYGLSLKSKQASFIGRIIIPNNQKKPPFWHYNLALNQYLFSSYHMNENNLPYYIEKLEKFNPDEIVGYPSSIYTLAKYIVENNIRTVRPKVVFGNSEPLYEYQREIMSLAFECPIRSWYSSTENIFFAYECKYKNYHIIHPFGIIEIIDDDGNIIENGTSGEMLCTGLTNYAMPFLRYKIGDSACLESSKCKCGNNSIIIKEIIGRTDDILITPEGRKIGRLDPVFKGLSGIKECQIIQKEIDLLQLRVVKERTYTNKVERILINALKKRVGEKMRFEFDYLDTIPRGNNGKFRAVISEINKI